MNLNEFITTQILKNRDRLLLEQACNLADIFVNKFDYLASVNGLVEVTNDHGFYVEFDTHIENILKQSESLREYAQNSNGLILLLQSILKSKKIESEVLNKYGVKFNRFISMSKEIIHVDFIRYENK